MLSIHFMSWYYFLDSFPTGPENTMLVSDQSEAGSQTKTSSADSTPGNKKGMDSQGGVKSFM